MKRILIVKVTSLGDVVQTLPVVADLHRAFPGVAVDWAVDESCAEVVRWHPGVSNVLCAPLRRFKKLRNGGDFKAISASIGALRAHRYDAVIDLHGVYKSAIISALARAARRVGYQTQDLGETGARFAYSHRFGPRPDCDAWHGMRVSAGEALGYVPEGVADHGIVAPQDARLPAALTDGAPFVLLFHATSNPDKQWPADHWAALATQMIARGVRVLLPWGSPAEHDDAQQIAARAPGAIVLPAMSVRELGAAIGLATLVVGVDTGFVHMAHALKRPTVMIFVATSRHHCGIGGAPHALSIGEPGAPPSVAQVLDAIDAVGPAHGARRVRLTA
ncbi:TPA: lipopolysaccharide heptosyltransferase I [Burkholderia vietnamiensis]|uniref:lipopolysaccharide heptosyltransferase I n=1 Tax=Burkholderia vietnamiensis TaxID=60552 RepID=UPI00075A6C72|nr:lipopolysaccharide heptosyltransferase I [Burkholderia vietnamiensis]KVE14127.1 ADP-heptose--LPS heptosyltransferase [Burkholderia vietnamiensis]MBE0630511.1 lipopolysaccharide heptosyltransferase I [Burkholderia vietnamiensis]MDN8065916.1 lipopolysaccharide heptosyltransferase I [Burkholderia vietnamiensis]HDR8920137.1 lipopolysaccharide heptosyltransferase I [Burkholderia vietnamiensis]HDR8977909.1 lipopolysaccharide heptosyltransferase I [Burkholderia vietnamiensis]